MPSANYCAVCLIDTIKCMEKGCLITALDLYRYHDHFVSRTAPIETYGLFMYQTKPAR